MQSKILALALSAAIMSFGVTACTSTSSSVAANGPKDTTTYPNLYYLSEAEAIDSLAILPPPPKVGSLAFLNDKAMYEQGVLMRNTPRGKLAAEDANLAGNGVVVAFSDAFGMPISATDTPEIYKLMTNMIEDAGDLATRSAKNYYNRIRPFSFYHTNTCNTTEQDKLSTNGSYPSGHTSIGWATALVLAEINPDRRDEILKRGYELGQSRVICGYHWQSDVDAARIVGSAIVPILHNNARFLEQLDKAKAEFAQKKASMVKPTAPAAAQASSAAPAATSAATAK